MTALVTKYLPLVADAPRGIDRIRGLIFELAVRGKLVEQDIREEPAWELLRHIDQASKNFAGSNTRSTKSAKSAISRGNNLSLPGGWAIASLERLTTIRGGSTPSMAIAEFWGGEIPWVSPKDMHSGEIVGSELKLTSLALEATRIELVPVGSILLVGRSGILKRKLPVQITRVPCTVNQDIKALTPMEPMGGRYLQVLLRGYERQILAEDVKTGTTVQSVVFDRLFSREFGLPPLPEQNRIIAKVDELMALCDRLEADQADAEAAHTQLVKALLDSLTQATDAADFRASWQRLSGHFHTLFTTEGSIDALKMAVLRLATVGKLVPQVESDGSATEFLKSIEKFRKKTILAAKIDSSELPKIPPLWSWIQIADIANVGTGATPNRTNPAYFNPGEVHWVTSGETSQAFICGTEQKVSSLALAECNLTVYPVGTLIVAMYGQGKTRGQVSELQISACTNQACAAIQLFCDNHDHRKYVKYFFKKSYDELRSLAAGGAQPNLNLSKIKEAWMPLPPLREQLRIVAKIEKLLAVCDILKHEIATSKLLLQGIAQAITNDAISRCITSEG